MIDKQLDELVICLDALILEYDRSDANDRLDRVRLLERIQTAEAELRKLKALYA